MRTTLFDLQQAVFESDALWVSGSNSKQLTVRAGIDVLDLTQYSGIIEMHPEDQVAVVRAGTLVSELQSELAKFELCLPLPEPSEVGLLASGCPGTIGGLLAMNLPHALWSQCRGARDWTLGCTIIRPDGSVAKSGCKAVKSVAGFDVHKLMVGARGTLGVLADVILRLYPLKARPIPKLIRGQSPELPLTKVSIHRVRHDDFSSFLDRLGASVIVADPESSTVWTANSDVEVPPFGWSIVNGRVSQPKHDQLTLMKRAKSIFDPTNKLNPGAMEFL